jgi:D-apionolactonase
MSDRNVYYYGSRAPLPEQRPLRAGPLSLIYEQGDLRYIKLGEREVIRRIYVAVRDRNWGTILPVLSNVQLTLDDDSFEITYDVENRRGDIDFAWKGAISGDARGTIHFSMDGEACSTFWRNRIGFCVLHPIRECAGVPCRVEKVDGTREDSRLPLYNAPHQPFMDMRAIAHEVLPDLWAEVRFEGDVFEMEDQRNWIDASYKTYCTPIGLKFPVEVQKGTRVRQSVTLTIKGKKPPIQTPAVDSTPITISLSDAPAVTLPRIGLGCASHGQALAEKEIARLKALNLSHLRVDLTLSEPDTAQKLQRATGDARALGIPLEVALTISADVEQELNGLAALLPTVQPKVQYWLVLSAAHKATPEALLHLACKTLSAYDPSARFGGGTNYYFTELNRNRPASDTPADYLNYSANPQVHAFDNGSISETCEALSATIATARQFVNGRPLSISPVTLKTRINPDATAPESPTPPGELPRRVEPRQMSLFGAAWTLGSFKYIAESGAVDYVTYYETTGWLGVMETEAGSPLPDKFPSTPGAVYPLYHVLADIGEFTRGQVRPVISSDTLRVEAILLQNPEHRRARLLLANWTAKPQQVRVLFGTNGTVRVLDETNVEQATQSPEAFRSHPGEPAAGLLTLRPFAIARVDMDLA